MVTMCKGLNCLYSAVLTLSRPFSQYNDFYISVAFYRRKKIVKLSDFAKKWPKGASTPSNIASNIAGNSFHLNSGVQGWDIFWQLIASNVPSTSSNIAGKIKGLKISFCLILMPNFECEEVILSFNFLYSFLNMSLLAVLHEQPLSVTNINLL